MDSNRFCLDRDTPDIVTHYEIPRETYCRLQDLVLLMEESESTKPFAATLRSMFGEIACVLEN